MDRSFQLLDEITKAEAGDTAAMRRVAYYLLYESDMEDLEEEIAERCLRYLHAAIETGDPDAMLDLGGMYISGRGVPKDRNEALYWYGKAAELNFPVAFHRIAQAYLYDDDTENLGYLPPTDDPERLGKAFDYFKRGADLGDAGCMVELGIMYMQGECVDPDQREGFRLFRKAYDALPAEPEAHEDAAYHLALCFHHGKGTGRNLAAALEYAEEARRISLREYREGRSGTYYFVKRSDGEIQEIIAEMTGDCE